jgi:hypothetical protein
MVDIDPYDLGYNEGRAETLRKLEKRLDDGSDLREWLNEWADKLERLGNWPEGVNRIVR